MRGEEVIYQGCALPLTTGGIYHVRKIWPADLNIVERGGYVATSENTIGIGTENAALRRWAFRKKILLVSYDLWPGADFVGRYNWAGQAGRQKMTKHRLDTRSEKSG